MGVHSLPLQSFKVLTVKYRSLMENLVLPVTLKGIDELSQEYLEKYCRHYVKKRFNSFLSSFKPTGKVSVQESSETELKRYLRQLSPDSLEAAAQFCSELAATEPEIVELYEATVLLPCYR